LKTVSEYYLKLDNI